MIPLGDDTPTIRTPVMTYLLIGLNVAVWLTVQGGGFDPNTLAKTVCDLGMVPGELTHMAALGTSVPLGPGLSCVVDNDPINVLTPLISMFLHGGWMHLLGNMIYLAVFGRNVEDAMGRTRFLAFYLICGLVAAATHIVFNASSPVPTVGASGAISGVLGAFLILYPRTTVRMFVIIFVVRVRAWVVLIYWFALQALGGLSELNQINPSVSGGTAVWAHVGGFLAGVALARFFVNPELLGAPVSGAGSGYPDSYA
jgi:membrane associated rhomboid family serine protease